VSKTKQADGGIHEDQLLNFLVNRLDEEVSLSLANNAEITAEDIYGVSSALAPTGPSVSTLCASSQNSPAGNTVLYHLRTKFEPEQLERVANTLLRKDLDELLPEQVEVVSDLHPALLWRRRRHRRSLSLPSEAWNHRIPRLRHTLRACEEQTLHAGGAPSDRRRHRQQ